MFFGHGCLCRLMCFRCSLSSRIICKIFCTTILLLIAIEITAHRQNGVWWLCMFDGMAKGLTNLQNQVRTRYNGNGVHVYTIDIRLP